MEIIQQQRHMIPTSVADLGCLSRIPDPKTAMKDRGEKIFVVLPFFWSHKYHKIEVFNFWNGEEKNLGQFSKNYRTFYPKKLSLSSQKYGFGIRYPGSEIRDPEKTYSVSRIPGSKRHRIPDPDPQHCWYVSQINFWRSIPRLLMNIWMFYKIMSRLL